MNWKLAIGGFIGGSISYGIFKDLGLRLDGSADFAAYLLAVGILFTIGWVSSDQ